MHKLSNQTNSCLNSPGADMNKLNPQKGLTLIELMVGMLVGAVALTIAWELFGFLHKGYIKKKLRSEEFQLEYVAEARLKSLILKYPIHTCQLGKLRLEASPESLIEVNDSLLTWIPKAKSINSESEQLTSGQNLIHIQINYPDLHYRNLVFVQDNQE
jgi:prepilin-type N-terminal cleavage/methylation domain-containing protein